MPTPSRTTRFTGRCDAHAYHSPVPDYLELHHVVPRDWQAAWRPDGATGVVWLPILTALCRTGHGNVHYILERLTRAWAATAATHDLDKAEAIVVEQMRADGVVVGREERRIARRGCDLWVERGGSLQLLVDGGHWGEI